MNYQPFNDRQGRDNPHSLNASRSALGLPPLHRDVTEQEDAPLYTPYTVSDLLPAWLRFLCVVAAAACMAIACGACDPIFPR